MTGIPRQEIVRRQGGALTAANLEPAGCRFTVRLPQMVSPPLEGGGAVRPAHPDSALPAASEEQGP